MNIGEKVKEQRLKKGFTQEQLGEILNVSRSTISSWEVGRNYPDLETIVAISDLFGISLDHLLREDTSMTKKLSNKMKRSTYYKRILIVGGLLLTITGGSIVKLRMDQHRYERNLNTLSWVRDKANLSAYSLKETGTVYDTYIMNNGWNPIPLEEHHPWVIARKEPLVVEIKEKNQRKIILSKENDKKAPCEATVIVDKNAAILETDKNWSTQKKQAIQAYLKENHDDYVDLLKNAVEKRKAIIAKH